MDKLIFQKKEIFEKISFPFSLLINYLMAVILLNRSFTKKRAE